VSSDFSFAEAVGADLDLANEFSKRKVASRFLVHLGCCCDDGTSIGLISPIAVRAGA
jgi:hypothetical protein